VLVQVRKTLLTGILSHGTIAHRDENGGQWDRVIFRHDHLQAIVEGRHADGAVGRRLLTHRSRRKNTARRGEQRGRETESWHGATPRMKNARCGNGRHTGQAF
jgi:hypothetical protein